MAIHSGAGALLSRRLRLGKVSTPTADSLYSLFPTSITHPVCTPISGEQMPEPYRSLLVHTHHMTVTVERHYGGPVDVQVLRLRRKLAGGPSEDSIIRTARGTGYYLDATVEETG